jgi:hypothetical protein
MKALLREIEEINRMKTAIKTTSSNYVKTDYIKNIKKRLQDIKLYCKYKNYNYDEIATQYRL